MITIGLDPHPGSHTVAALDEQGTLLGSLTVANTPEGLAQLHAFAQPFSPCQWAIEGAANRFITAFVSQLLTCGALVTHIPPTLTSQYRARKGRKKNDVVDAQNAARALMANPDLPRFAWGTQQRDLQDLTNAQRRLSHDHQAHKATLAALDPTSPVRPVLEAVMHTIHEQLKLLEKQLKEVVTSLVPSLLDVQGVGPVVAGIVLGETGRIERFKNKNHFASYCGAAPVERGSGQNTRMQLNTSGNRRLNWALHIVAIVRLRQDERTRIFLARLKAAGKTQRASLRILKTYIAREPFTLLRQAASTGTTGSPGVAAGATRHTYTRFPAISLSAHAPIGPQAGQFFLKDPTGVLTSSIAVMEQTRCWATTLHGHLEGSKRQCGWHMGVHGIAHHGARMQIEGHRKVQPAFSRRNERDIGSPDRIGLPDVELTVQEIRADRKRMGTVRGAYMAALSFGAQTSGTHQAGDALPGNLHTFRAQLGMNARGSVASFAKLVDFPDALLEQRIPLLLVGDRPSSPTVVPAHRDLQHATHHVQTVLRTVVRDEVVPQRVVSLAKKRASVLKGVCSAQDRLRPFLEFPAPGAEFRFLYGVFGSPVALESDFAFPDQGKQTHPVPVQPSATCGAVRH